MGWWSDTRHAGCGCGGAFVKAGGHLGSIAPEHQPPQCFTQHIDSAQAVTSTTRYTRGATGVMVASRTLRMSRQMDPCAFTLGW
jgi:hypothetical protein